MDETAKLHYPLIMPSQAQKHVTHNMALEIADTLVQLSVRSRALAAAPARPSEGDAYLVADDATGAWTGESGRIAVFRTGAWQFLAPNAGWRAYVEDEALFVLYAGGVWQVLGEGGPGLACFGVNTEADTANRLAVTSPGTLFSHEGGGHRVKVNKAGTAETASVLFQTDWSGRAELGLTGDDDWHVKVSADGATWTESMTVRAASGFLKVGTAAGAPAAPLHVLDGRAVAGAHAKPFKLHVPGAGAGDTVQFCLGVSETAFNQAELGFNYEGGAGSSGNSFSIGLGGVPPVAAFHGTGAVTFPSIATTANAANACIDAGASNSLLRSTSSEAYKRDIEPIDPARAHALMAVEPIWYRSKSAADNPHWSWYGFSAERVAQIDPRLVTYGYREEDYETLEVRDGKGAGHQSRRLRKGAVKKPDGVAYERFVAHHHVIITELLERVEALEKGAAAARPA